MKFSQATPQERAALVRMVSASADLIIFMGRAIRNDLPKTARNLTEYSAEFVAAVIEVQEQSK